jgi:putative Holliday junction resolvase
MKNIPEILLGFDFGMKRIGVAVGQTVTRSATPLGVIAANQGVPQLDKIAKLIKTWQPQALVVGIPLNMDGTEQPLTAAAKHFAQLLEKEFAIPVFEMDERLTSVEAKARAFDAGGYKALQKTQIDSIAAQLILQNWLAQQSADET